MACHTVSPLQRRVVAALALAAGLPAAAQDVAVTYVRCPRTETPIELTGEVTVDGATRTQTLSLKGADGHDVLPDVTHFLGDFTAPCDLMLRETDGSERVLYDCSTPSTDADACAAMDPAVSFDGRQIAFAVFRGRLVRSPQVNFTPITLDPRATNTASYPYTYPNKILRSTSAQLHVVDVASGSVRALPQPAGVFDSGPAWLSNGRLAFTSTRLNIKRANVPGSTSTRLVAQLWTIDPDGRNAMATSPHALGGYEHPLQLKDGRLVFSSWQGFGTITFRTTNGSPGGFGTIDNFFNLYAESPDGARTFSLFGQHGGGHNPNNSPSLGPAHLAAHFVGQSSDGRVWTADYYRANNNGFGVLFGFSPPDAGTEGWGPGDANRPNGHLYMPRDWVRAATWDSNADNSARPTPLAQDLRHPNYADRLVWLGKLGHPSPLPDNDLLLTWGKGACSTVASAEVYTLLGEPIPSGSQGTGPFTVPKQLTGLNRDNPSCDAGIYRLRDERMPSTSPADLELVVDHRAWHEIMPRAVVAYSRIHGQPMPAEPPPVERQANRPELPRGTPFGLIGAASLINRETHPVGGIHFAGERQFAAQGTDTIAYGDHRICGIRLLGILPNKQAAEGITGSPLGSLAGERVVLLGEVPVRNHGGNGAPLIDSQGNPDTSFLLRMPASLPYLMQAIDCEGRTLNTDQSWQGLRPGEMKTCNGCHVHGRPAGIDFAGTRAAQADYPVARLGEGQVPLLTGGEGTGVGRRLVAGYGLQLEFERDIQPLLVNRCGSCHSSAAAQGNFVVDRPGQGSNANGATPSTWWCLVRDTQQACVPEAQRFVTDAGAAGSTRLRRPQATRYIRVFNALGSLLYWKAAGQRTDGLTDATFTSASPRDDRDIDFGAAHPGTMTAEELGLLSRWIDLGAHAGSRQLIDTLDPTLHVAASVAGGGLSQLHVGTVDVPSGINPASLVVCRVDGNGACGPNLAPPAQPHGVVDIPFSPPLGDPDEELRIEVRDVAGNRSQRQHTVRWLIAQGSPNPRVFSSGFEF